MNRTDQLAHQLHIMIVNSPEFQAYQQDCSILKKHPEIFEMEKQLKVMQQKIMQLKTDPETDPTLDIQIYEKSRSAFENHPLVVNYLFDKANLESLLEWIKDAIEGQLNA